MPSADCIWFDQYNQWWAYQHLTTNEQGQADSYHPFNAVSKVLGPLNNISAWGKVSGVAEYGVHHPWSNSLGSPVIGDDVAWMAAAFQYAVDNGSAALCYFDSGLNSPRGPWDMSRHMEPPDYTFHTDPAPTRLDQFIANAARIECGTPSQALA